jgi:hypothetical protein
MFWNQRELALHAGECQQERYGHRPDLFRGQGFLAEKLALEYDACQLCLSSLIGGKGREEALAPAVSCCQRKKFQQFIKHLGL